MKRKTISWVIIALLSALVLASKSEIQEDITAAAAHFLDLFNDDVREQANLSMEAKERYNWHYFPRARKGIAIEEMTDDQKGAAHELLRSSLSEQGYAKATGVIELEDILRQVEGRGSNDSFRDPGKYYFTTFGMPAHNQPWGWRLEGHHLSLNFVIIDNQLAASTPAFFGANPSEIPFGDDKGKRILRDEEDFARQLIKTLSPSQQSKAIIATNAPWDIITGTDRKPSIGAPAGISFNELTTKQQNLFMDLVKTYLFNNRNDFAQTQLNKLQAEGPQNLYFAWAGGLEKGQKHYYRIQGSSLLIEYDNTQNNANHIHTVVRDLENDFGEDVLRKHYEDSHHN